MLPGTIKLFGAAMRQGRPVLTQALLSFCVRPIPAATALSDAGRRRPARGSVCRGFLGRRGFLLLLRQAALQRVHQVDDLGRLGDLARRDALPLGLLRHELAQSILVAVAEARRIELAGPAVDDRLGDPHHVGIDLTLGRGAELGGADFVGAADRRHDETAVARLDQHQPLAPRHRHPAQPDLVLVLHRLADHAEGLGGELTIRIHVIGRVEVDRIDFVAVDKALEVDDLRRLDLQCLQFVVVDRHIAAALILVPFDDLVAVDDLAGLRVDELLLHTVAGFAVELIEPDAFRLGRGGDQSNRAADQR